MKSVKKVLDQLDKLGVTQVTFESVQFDEELWRDDSDYTTFHKGKNYPFICHILEVCDHVTSEKPVYKDWYSTTNCHS